MVHLGEAKDAIASRVWDHIISDPPYDDMPSILFLREHCKGNIVLFCDPLKRPKEQPDEILFWIKTPSTKNTSRKCSRFVEEILVYRTEGSTFNRLHWSVMTGVFTDAIIVPSEHPWKKPLSLMEKLLRIYTKPGDAILDPYAGSGTTWKAGELCDRTVTSYDNDKFWGTVP